MGMVSMMSGVTPEMLREYEEHVNQVLKEKGDLWVMAALFYGSVGYYTPNKSQHLLNEWKQGDRESWSERCLGVFDGNSIMMIYCDVRRFEACSVEEQEETMRRVEALKGADWITQTTVSMLEPTRCSK